MANRAEKEFFFDYGDPNRYVIKKIIGKGSYGVVCSAYDTRDKVEVAIKRINDVFEHVSDAVRILREIKLLRHLKHPDVVAIKNILLPPSPRDFKDIYVVFELMESDLHQVIKANDDLSDEHHQFFLFQMLRGLRYIHAAKVFHRDLKPKNILANSDCKLKICDFGLARPAFVDAPSTIFWTDYVATRWYRAPELCGSFFSKYSPKVDVWSIGCIFAEILMGKPLFPGKNVVHQLELITNISGTPSDESIAKIRNDKARRYLEQMPKKPPLPLDRIIPHASPGALSILRKLLMFDPDHRASAEEALMDPYFADLLQQSGQDKAPKPLSKIEYSFDMKRMGEKEIQELIYREILEYHHDARKDYLSNNKSVPWFASAVDKFKMQFKALENKGPLAPAMPSNLRGATSLPRPGMSREMMISDAHSPSAADVLSTSFSGTTIDKDIDFGGRGGYGARDVVSASFSGKVGGHAAMAASPPEMGRGASNSAAGGQQGDVEQLMKMVMKEKLGEEGSHNHQLQN